MNYNTIRDVCSIVRVLVGSALIGYAIYSTNFWFLLGIIPLIAGLTKFCPLCIISGKCDLPSR